MLKLVQIMQRRELQGKDTVFFVRSRPVRRKNIKRFIRRMGDDVIASNPDCEPKFYDVQIAGCKLTFNY